MPYPIKSLRHVQGDNEGKSTRVHGVVLLVGEEEDQVRGGVAFSEPYCRRDKRWCSSRQCQLVSNDPLQGLAGSSEMGL